MSLVYGVSGSTNIPEILAFYKTSKMTGLDVLAMVFLVAGFWLQDGSCAVPHVGAGYI